MNNEWYKEAVFYEVFVRAFFDSDGNGIGDLAGLTSKLDYLQWLGVTAIWLLPIYPSPLKDDGYDIMDYYSVHSDYGTIEDFQNLTREVHRRGMHIVVDLVINHTSNLHPWFQASRDPYHPDHFTFSDWYVWSETDKKYSQARVIFNDTEKSNWELDPVRRSHFWHRFFHHQPDLNFDNIAVQREMLKVSEYWMDIGVDGFRVDATPYLFEREGTNCDNLEETHEYLKRMRAFADAYAPGTMLLSEANQWPEDVLPYFGEGDEFHMNFHFPLMPRVFMALARKNIEPIIQIMERTPDLPPNCQWATFLRCHDELTLEMVTPEEREEMWDFYAPQSRMRLNLGIRRRLAPLLDNNQQRIELAYSILLTFIGSPVIYYGDEIGMGDNIWLDDRDGVRTPMQWDDQLNAGFSDADSELLYSSLIDDDVFGYKQVNVARQHDDPDSLLNHTRDMINTRKTYPAFGKGELQIIQTGNPAVLAYLRSLPSQTLLVINNISPDSQLVTLDLSHIDHKLLLNIYGEGVLSPGSPGIYTVGLNGYEFGWFAFD